MLPSPARIVMVSTLACMIGGGIYKQKKFAKRQKLIDEGLLIEEKRKENKYFKNYVFFKGK